MSNLCSQVINETGKIFNFHSQYLKSCTKIYPFGSQRIDYIVHLIKFLILKCEGIIEENFLGVPRLPVCRR